MPNEVDKLYRGETDHSPRFPTRVPIYIYTMQSSAPPSRGRGFRAETNVSELKT